MFGMDAGRLLSLAAWGFCAGQVFFLVGLLRPVRLARPLLLAYVAANILALAVVLWFFVFVGLAWGIGNHDWPALAPLGAYFAFLTWALFYLFHPDVSDYLLGYLRVPAA